MSLSIGASNNNQDVIIISDDSDGDDSSNSHDLTSVADNETLILGSVDFSQEVDQEITSHSTKTLQPVESHKLASTSRTIRLKHESTRALARGPMIRGSNAVVPRRPYRSQRMRASNDYEVMKEKRKRSTKKSAMPKRKKSAP
ncbi:hypothetical protein KY289_009361 [Solanum tuberosum]|nr:hypothetical protein KY289_009361 [Solanum tuberosum]